MIYHPGLTVKELTLFNTTFLEYIALKVVSSSPLLLLLVYGPPKPAASFWSELIGTPHSHLISLLCRNCA